MNIHKLYIPNKTPFIEKMTELFKKLWEAVTTFSFFMLFTTIFSITTCLMIFGFSTFFGILTFTWAFIISPIYYLTRKDK